jgi:hypothetical protein
MANLILNFTIAMSFRGIAKINFSFQPKKLSLIKYNYFLYLHQLK